MLRRAAAAALEEVTPRNKIRKRCALSSSSSSASDALRKLRLKRGVVLRRSSPCLGNRRKMSESSWNGRCRADGMHSSVSARKLVSALWQMNEGGLFQEEEDAGIARDAAARRGSAAHRRCASLLEITKRSRTKSKVLDGDHGEWFSDKLSYGGRIGVHACAADSSSTCSVDRMAHLHDMYNSLTASKELVRVLANVWGPGVLNPSTASIISALRSELDLARAHARQIAKEQNEVELLKKRLAAEAHAWKRNQREKVAATVRVVAEELDGERRSRRRAERVNAKLGKALAETESSLEASRRELERERRSREHLEMVCGELVRGAVSSSSTVGEVEEMRREAETAQAELDKEREMLRLADELREERVQMKLLEARLQFEEKNAVVEQLRGELEAFLQTKKHDNHESSAAEQHQACDDHHASEAEGANGIARVSVSKRTDGEDDDDDREQDDSEGSDMHSIELNMDGNTKDCGWSYSTAANSKDMTTSKKAASASSRGTECAIDPWAGASFDRRSPEESDGGQQWDWDVDDEGCSDTTRDIDQDSERYQAIKNLREQMLAGHGSIFMSQADRGNADSKQHRYGMI